MKKRAGQPDMAEETEKTEKIGRSNRAGQNGRTGRAGRAGQSGRTEEPGGADAPRPFSLSVTTDVLKKALALTARTLRLASGREAPSEAPEGESGGDAVTAMLTATGELLDVSRVYVMLDEKDGRYLRNTHEWVNRDIGPAMSSWPLHDYERDLPSLKPLMRGREYLAAHSEDTPPDLEITLRKQAVDSILLVPLLRDGQWTGMTGFDSCGRKRLWSDAEILLLRHLADAVVLALDRGEAQALHSKLDRVCAVLEEGEPAPFAQRPAQRRAPREKNGLAGEVPTLKEMECRLIMDALRRNGGNKRRAAAQLGLTWAALDRRCKKLDVRIFKG